MSGMRVFSSERARLTSPGCTAQNDQLWHRGDTNQYESEGEGELYEFGQVRCALPCEWAPDIANEL